MRIFKIQLCNDIQLKGNEHNLSNCTAKSSLQCTSKQPIGTDAQLASWKERAREIVRIFWGDFPENLLPGKCPENLWKRGRYRGVLPLVTLSRDDTRMKISIFAAKFTRALDKPKAERVRVVTVYSTMTEKDDI